MSNKNPYAKSRSKDDPYAVYRNGSWEYRILKLYQRPDLAAKNPYAVALCAVKSPHTFGSFDIGDTYLSDIGPTFHVKGPDILKECGRNCQKPDYVKF